MDTKQEREIAVAPAAACSACPICGKPLWFYDCCECCPSCNIEIPCSLEDRIEKAKDDEWGLYAFYGRLEELKGRRVKPSKSDPHPNFTEDEHVIISEVHPPNSVRISYLDGFSVGLRWLSDLNLSSLPNDERTHGAPEESQGSEIEELKHRCRDAACCASSFSSEDAATTRRNAERLGVDPDEFMEVVEKAARFAEITSEEAEACNQSPSQSP